MQIKSVEDYKEVPQFVLDNNLEKLKQEFENDPTFCYETLILGYAAKKGYVEMVGYLLSCGVKPEINISVQEGEHSYLDIPLLEATQDVQEILMPALQSSINRVQVDGKRL